MNSVVRRVAPPVLLALVATGLAAAPAGAAPTWVAPAVTLAEGTSARPPGDSHVVVDAAGNATVGVGRAGGTPRTTTTCWSRRTRSAAPGRRRSTSRARGDIADSIDIATNASGITVAVWTRSNGTHDVLRGRDPRAWWSLVGPRPGRRHTVNSRGAAGGRGRCRQRGRHVRGERRAAHAPLRHQARGSSLGRRRTTCRTPPRAWDRFYDLAVTPGGQATVAWQPASPSTDRRVIQAAVRAPGGTFGDPETVSSATTDTWEPALAVNAAGVATATWYQDTATAALTSRPRPGRPNGTWSPAQDVSAAGG